MKEITVQAAAGNLARVTAFVNETLRKMGCSTRNRVDIDVAIDEVFANIVTYGYGTTKGLITIRVETTEAPRSVVITFSDSGQPFDPLSASEPNISLPLNKRPVGGLGIFMMKKTMDEASYHYSDGQNILTIRKLI